MPDPNIRVLQKETYLKAVGNAVGSRLFNSLYVQFADTGKTADVLEDGTYSCAFFVSAVLCLFQAMHKPHATVANVRKEITESTAWQSVPMNDIRAGDVLFWEKIRFDDGSENAHVGFAITNEEAVSTDYKQRVIARHPIIGGNKRKVEAVYRYSWPE